MKTSTSSCRPSRSSTHPLSLALYHVIWRLPSSNPYWKGQHLTRFFWKKKHRSISVQNPWKGRSPQTSLPSLRLKQPEQPLSVSLSSSLADDKQLQKSAPLSEVNHLTKELDACRRHKNTPGWQKIRSKWTTTKRKLFSFTFRLPWNFPPFHSPVRLLLALTRR